jgi:hypothetical protein
MHAHGFTACAGEQVLQMWHLAPAGVQRAALHVHLVQLVWLPNIMSCLY